MDVDVSSSHSDVERDSAVAGAATTQRPTLLD
jgi:hypothetical protein